MSIFSKLFGKKKNEDQWAKRPSEQDIRFWKVPL